MADEMEESWDSEEKDLIPKDKAAEPLGDGTSVSRIEESPVGELSADEAAGTSFPMEAGKTSQPADAPLSDSVPDEIAASRSSGLTDHASASSTTNPEVPAESAVRDDGSSTSKPQGAWVKPAQADSPGGAASMSDLDKPGLDLLYDVELDATLQFGSKEMLLRDVLELGPGDVVELDRHIAEPVDLVVGDRIVARGEVVVASGNFALRVTEVATPQMRLESIRCLF